MDFGALIGPSIDSGITGGKDVLTNSWKYVDAFSAYVVFKRQVTLDWVRVEEVDDTIDKPMGALGVRLQTS